MLSIEDLLEIRDLPDGLRTEHCYNDLQHAMLVILFRHTLLALTHDNLRHADQMLDNATLYLYIHFLNEEEGMVYKNQQGLIDPSNLKNHSAMHIKFLEYWKTQLLHPYKRGDVSTQEMAQRVSKYYNVILKHIEETDIHEYGPQSAITVEQTRNEMARISETRMPMSPYMPGAFETVKILDPDAAAALNPKYLSPTALQRINTLNLIPGAGRILTGAGSLRDRFVSATRGDQNSATNLAPLQLAA